MTCVFIGGCERSGTTMLGSLLGTGRGSVMTPESQFKTRLPLTRPDVLQDRTSWQAALARNERFRLWGIDAPEPRSSSWSDYMLDLVRAFHGQDYSHWIDHTPDNMQHAMTLDSLFPESKFIHIVRDGRAILASMKRLDWGTNDPRNGARLWLRKSVYGFAVESTFGTDRVIRIRYEDILDRPEQVIEQLSGFTGIDHISLDMEASKDSLPAYTHSQHELVGSALASNKADEWRSVLTEREIEIFESEAHSLLSMLDYPLMFGAGARPMSGAEKLLSRFKLTFEHRFRRFRKKRRFRQHTGSSN